MESTREHALVQGLREGVPGAFDAVYDAWRPRVYGYLARLCGDPTLAADLSQEVWLRLASHAPRLQPGTQLTAWLFTVARNLFRSHRRWAWLRGQRLVELTFETLTHAADAPSPFESLCADDAQRRLERALAGVPEKYREALLLVCVEGLSPSEAATVAGITPENLRQRLARGRTLLSDALTAADRSA
ncbi:RNA polymerase sigma factor [Myxococcota bacterium]|nr:RNA polymerase sigma factor [Myxococcota bacterium]